MKESIEKLPMHTFGIKKELTEPFPIGAVYLSPNNPSENGISGIWIQKTILWEKIREE